ncbi:Serine protease inhibitor A3N, partial [Sigmodon hispidus]
MVLLAALWLLMAGFCPAVLCQPDGTLGRETTVQDDQNKGTQMDSLTLASINTNFAFSLYKELVVKNPDKNIVFSPLSVSAALAVLSLGASNNTLKEILEGLKFNLTETPEEDIHRGFGHLLHMLCQPGDQVQIRTGSTIFVEKHLQILAEFKEKIRSLYQAEASTADFQQPHEAIKLINDYVSKQTQGKIQKLISDLDESISMVLVNYIFFKGKWRVPFVPQLTHDSSFYVDKKRTVKVPMMKRKFLTTPYFRDEELSCSVVELKYRGNASALFILPDEGKMQQVEASLQPETLRKWKDSLRPRKIDELCLPKFSISTDYSLENILPQLGIREVFSTQADLSRITGTKDLRVSQVVHKAVLDVAETGTEAAAATGFLVMGSALILSPLKVHFDRPFLMIISKTNTQTPLFMAKVLQLDPITSIPMRSEEDEKVDPHNSAGGEDGFLGLGHFKDLQGRSEPHEAKKLISGYVRKQTKGKIKDLISDLDERTSMVLVNYIYFKGKWKMSFGPHDTLESEFYVDKKRTAKVPVMKIEDLTTPYFWDEELSCSIVKLKYTGNTSALFILPDKGRMQKVEASLQTETQRKWKDSLRPRVSLMPFEIMESDYGQKIDEPCLPKFSISTDYSLENILPQLGIREVFSRQADLSGITGAKDLRVSKVLHKPVLDVAETGENRASQIIVNIFDCVETEQNPVGEDLEYKEGYIEEESDAREAGGVKDQKDQDKETKVDSQTLASINTAFAFSLYKKLVLNNPDKNIVFSPLSISTALAVLSLGARSNTLKEILEGLKFNLTETPEADIHRSFGNFLHMLGQPGDQVQIRTGSAMFIEKRLQILAEFKEKARSLYQAEASTADFQKPNEAKRLINNYVRNQTQGKIQELISELDVRTLMVLVNYIYFKGKWKMPFDPNGTLDSEFYVDKKRTVMVPMMSIEDLTTPYFRDEELSCSVVELKYTGNASALFILPDEGKMQQVEASLQPETLRKWKDSLRPRKINELSLPKFSISTDYNLKDILPQLGIRKVFSTQADLSGITGAKNLKVYKVLHKAVLQKAMLDVVESGTEAAATTGFKENRKDGPPYSSGALDGKVLPCCSVPTRWHLGKRNYSPGRPKHGIQEDSLTLTSFNIDFAFNFYKELVLKNPNENIFFSPFSISAVLAGLSLGARSNTLEEILEGLKFNLTEMPESGIHQGFGHFLYMLSQPRNQVQVITGSAMFIENHQQILAKFKLTSSSLLKPKKLINDYVKKQTQEKIQEPISDLHGSISMVLVNYIYFKDFSEKGKTWFPQGRRIIEIKDLRVSQSEVSTVDSQQPCEAKKLINNDVKKLSQGKIKMHISDLGESTSIVLVNYIYFIEFLDIVVAPGTYRTERFFLSQCSRVSKLPLMQCGGFTNVHLRFHPFACKFHDLEGIYNGGMFTFSKSLQHRLSTVSLLVIIDLDGEPAKMNGVEMTFLADSEFWAENVKSYKIIDEFCLPKFSITTDYSMENILPQLGIREVFSIQFYLSRTIGTKDQISGQCTAQKVFHKALLDVVESGTEAAAATEFNTLHLLRSKKKIILTKFSNSFFCVLLVNFEHHTISEV